MTKNEKRAALRVFAGLLSISVFVVGLVWFPYLTMGLVLILSLLFMILKVYVDIVNSLDAEDAEDAKKEWQDRKLREIKNDMLS
jgi:hypothetical protein